MSEKTCDGCSGKCCKYVVTEIDIPQNLEDFEEIKWFVCHKNVQVFVEEDGAWNLEFLTPCINLDENSKCRIYSKRPNICREYTHDECPFHNEYLEIFVMKSIKDVEEYIEKIFNKGLHVIKKKDEEDETQDKNPPEFVAGKD